MNLYSLDAKRYPKHERDVLKFWKNFRRIENTNNPLIKKFYRKLNKKYATVHGLEIPEKTKIGKGFYIGHPYNITINPNAVIGENVNIHKGVTIGQENRGHRKGAPVIGNEVWIGVNATIVGKITVGDDCLIAANSFVNCDVPSHSVVYGNPCIIKHRENATEGYINNKV